MILAIEAMLIIEWISDIAFSSRAFAAARRFVACTRSARVGNSLPMAAVFDSASRIRSSAAHAAKFASRHCWRSIEYMGTPVVSQEIVAHAPVPCSEFAAPSYSSLGRRMQAF
ncbi:MAG TPA: hypothetical protein VN663_05550 [Ramlibacter sp.]|nr:hypothetical protein [Ramlibacter sp.]